jgi:D-alanyl-D-alanine carboxypeptidase
VPALRSQILDILDWGLSARRHDAAAGPIADRAIKVIRGGSLSKQRRQLSSLVRDKMARSLTDRKRTANSMEFGPGTRPSAFPIALSSPLSFSPNALQGGVCPLTFEPWGGLTMRTRARDLLYAKIVDGNTSARFMIPMLAVTALLFANAPLFAEAQITGNVPEAVPPGLDGIMAIPPGLCQDMKQHHVLNAGAPVGCDRLKLVTFSYLGFDGRYHDDGQIIVMDAVAKQVLQIFATLRAKRFPLAQARLMNSFDGDDERSMAEGNTSAFNVRAITGGGAVSLHAYGVAIDINPIQNPYVRHAQEGISYSPKAGADYRDRGLQRPGMVEPIIQVFYDHGFSTWGGKWKNPTDYQHFQLSRALAEHLARLSPAQAEAYFDEQASRKIAVPLVQSRTAGMRRP